MNGKGEKVNGKGEKTRARLEGREGLRKGEKESQCLGGLHQGIVPRLQILRVLQIRVEALKNSRTEATPIPFNQ